jgi:alpha-galactosidase
MKKYLQDIALAGSMFLLLLNVSNAKTPNSFTKKVFGQIGNDTLKAQILTPPAPDFPRINGAKVFGVRPGSPFLFYVPATGIRPIVFSAKGLPKGLSLDANTGMITGSVAKVGTYNVMLKAKNAKGTATRNLKVVVGDTIALTPPMGWNSWNVFAANVSADKVKKAADAMVNSGLINHGWSYINIDDFWQNNHNKTTDQTLQGDYRDAQGNILPNARFPDMKGLADYIHNNGLKAGLYSSPGPYTCGRCAGSWQHELQDAKTYANWGFDFLKYDWCSYGRIVTDSTQGVPTYKNKGFDSAAAVYPYELMGKALKAQQRDIVYSLCQYGVGDVWKWGATVNGTCWRTTGDIYDSWEVQGKSGAQNSVSKIGFNQDQSASYSGPGRYNDPDMLVIGYVGWGKPHPTRLTPDEQYAHISLWCLLSAPLLLGCDLEKLDDFTLNLITNDEVIDIDQDPLAIGARRVSAVDSLEIFKKPLEDGSIAVGLFNRRSTKAKIKVSWSDLGISGKQIIRDVWRQKDIAIAKDNYETEVAAHGVVLLKLKSK